MIAAYFSWCLLLRARGVVTAVALAAEPSPGSDYAPTPCVEHDEPEPPSGSEAHLRWSRARADAAYECGDLEAAIERYEALRSEAAAQGHNRVRGYADYGLAQALLYAPEDFARPARLDRAHAVLTALLDEGTAAGHHPETVRLASRLVGEVETERVRLRASGEDTDPALTEATLATELAEPGRATSDPHPTPAGPTGPPASTRWRKDAAPTAEAVPRGRRTIGFATGGGVLLATGVALAGVAIAMRPWYTHRYEDAPGYSGEIARDLTRPYVVGYAVAASVGVAVGATLVALAISRRGAQRRARPVSRALPRIVPHAF